MAIVEKMYGSTHTHFEDLYDTANDLTKMVIEFANQGAKKVAATGHGNMFAYEDLKGIVSTLKKSKEIPEDFEIVPGVEVYFEDDAKHMVLVAEDYEGYKQLCAVVADSAKNSKSSKNTSEDIEYLTPIVTMENLERNIGSNPGHVYMASACIGGVFAKHLGLEDKIYIKNIQKKQSALTEMMKDVRQAHIIKKQWDDMSEEAKSIKMLKKDNIALEAALEAGDMDTAESYNKRIERTLEINDWKEEHKKERETAVRKIKAYETKGIELDEATKAYEEYKATFPQRMEEAKEMYHRLSSIFGENKIYFEIQNHGLEEEKIIFNNVITLAYSVGNPQFITSNDVHIGDRKDSKSWKNSLLKREVEKFKRYKHLSTPRGDEEEYGIKNDEELREELLKIVEPCNVDGVTHAPEEIVDNAIANIRKALESCHIEFPKISIDGINHYPKFCENDKEKFREEVEKGLKERFPNGLPEGYRERVDYEMSVIESMGFSSYLLIVQDYLKYTELLGYLRTEEQIAEAPLSIEELEKYIDENHIPRVGAGKGPARGSAAGSLAAYAMNITTIDPIKYDLMFERFLNPSRHEMPDIDSDIKNDVRDKLYDYICARWGEDCVCKICTKSYAYGKAAAGDAQRFLIAKETVGKDEEEEKEIKAEYKVALKKVSGMIEEIIGEDVDYVEDELLLDDVEYLAEKNANFVRAVNTLYHEHKIAPDADPSTYTEEDRKVANILEVASTIGGIPANISMHACGSLISRDPIKDVIPLAWNDKKQVMTTQCLYPQAEKLGLLKMDLLGLKNLGIISKVQYECYDQGREDLLRTIEGTDKILEDPRIFEEIFSKGRTLGVFQFESPGMRKMLKDFKPDCFEDIVLLNAAYRPGPLSFLPEVIAEKWYRKMGKESPHGIPDHKIKITDKRLTNILDKTYGVPIYQEQIMRIVQDLAGYTMSDADSIRKYMSKKKTAELEKERGFFVYGGEKVIADATAKLEQMKAISNPTEAQVKEMNVLEADIKDMEKHRYIKGCVPNGVCTAEEANALFDAMIDFGKYAFNKSHAVSYAKVAMFTAYQKLYHTDLFYKYTLANEMLGGADQKTKMLATEKYVSEMKDFGIRILPPDPTKSEADFTVEDGNIRMGFGCIKGCSYENYKHADNLLMFLARNPEVSTAQVATFVKLGLFDKIYPANTSTGKLQEKERIHGNRKEMEKWLEAHADEAKSFGLITAEWQALKQEVAKLDTLVKQGSSEAAIKLADVSEMMHAKELEVKTYRENILSASKVAEPFPERDTKAIINDRLAEYDKMGIAFSVSEDIDKLKKYGNNTTIKMIESNRNASNRRGDYATIAGTIIAKQKSKPGQKGPTYRITIMDKNGDTLQMGYWDTNDPTSEMTCGMFDISYGTYTNLNKVRPFRNELQKVETDPKKFVVGKTTLEETNPITGEKMLYQEKDEAEEEEKSEIE